MGYIKNIGFKNYRIFDKLFEFELSPITIVTGPNNSGKSSFFKGIKLLSNNAKQNQLTFLKFLQGNFANWETLTNNKTEDEEVVVRTEGIRFGLADLGVYLHFETGKLIKVCFKDGERIVFEISYSGNHESTHTGILNTIDIDFFKENLNAFHDHNTNLSLMLNSEHTEIKQVDPSTVLSSIHQESYHNRTSSKNFNKDSNPKIEIKNEVNKTEEKEPDFTIPLESGIGLISFEVLWQKYYEPELSDWENYNILSYLSSESLTAKIGQEILKKLKYSEKDIESMGFNDIEKLSNALPRDFKLSIENFIAKLPYAFKDLTKSLNNVHQYNPTFTFKDRIVLKKDLNYDMNLTEVLKEGTFIHRFITKHINNFGIGEKFSVRDIENYAYAFELEKENITYSFQDLGTGYSQIVELILTIALIGSKTIDNIGGEYITHPSAILIEEPEMSLHPSLQSKLADLFADAINHFSIQLIVETHSEYLIRKLQYLIAKKDISAESASIYYFNGRENMSSDNGRVCKRIEINDKGTLTDKFGKGFFDEATNWELELMKIHSIQAN